MSARRRVVRPVGDRALLVECTDGAEARALRATLESEPPRGVVDVVGGARTVLVRTRRAVAGLADELATRDVSATDAFVAGEVVVDVVYDGDDLADVAAHLGTDVDGVVRWHSATPWTAAFLGFAPGFAYLEREGDVREVPRRAEPRTSVPAGAVAVAGTWSAVYPRRSPGGWQVVGRTDRPLWLPDREPPAVLTAGTRVRFRPVRDLVSAGPMTQAAPGTAARPAREDAGGVLEVLDPGPLTLVEDLGRTGHQGLGVPESGALDRAAAVRANRLVGNLRGAAVLETLGGLALRARTDAVVALTGARADARLVPDADSPGHPAPPGRPVLVAAGTTLNVGTPVDGARCYVAVRGGVDAPAELGSRSADLLSGLGPAPLRAGDLVVAGTAAVDAVADPRDDPTEPTDRTVPDETVPGQDVVHVRAVPGPRTDWFTDDGVAFWATTWRVTADSNRVGLRLDGAAVPSARDEELASEPMVRGAVQVPPAGRPVVLLADHPATGGYPVVAVVVTDDLDLLGQLRPGDRVAFEPV